MLLVIAGLKAELELISFSEERLCRRLDTRAVSYELTVDGGDFVRRFGPIFDDCIAELLRDDEVVGEFQPPYTGAKAYPTLNEFLALDESLRMEMIDAFFTSDILRLYVREGGEARWLILNLNSLLRKENEIVISGRAVLWG